MAEGVRNMRIHNLGGFVRVALEFLKQEHGYE
jgi:hypothetical protein